MDRFNEFLVDLLQLTHAVEEFDRESYKHLIKDICETYGLSKGVAEFYLNNTQEKLGNGEMFCDYDDGKGTNKVLEIRVVTRTQAVILGSLYMSDDKEPLTEEQLNELDLLLRIILSFMSFRRLQRVVERLGFFDEDMYPNFRSFSRFLANAYDQQQLTGMMAFHMDLQNFTIINQEIGRKNGDTVMLNYFNLISKTIGEDGIICRLGGDKFVGIFKENVKDKLFEIFNGAPVSIDNNSERRIVVYATVGIYILPQTFILTSPGDIMDKVMMCSAIAKKKKDSNIVFYDQNLNNLQERSKWVQRKFHRAIADKEFKAFYQPKVDINTKKIIGAEALCRWFHEGGIIPPMDFIPILEQGLDICDLDFYMLDTVCADLRRWLDEGREPVRVSVNLSRKHLVDVDLLEHIMAIINGHDVPHELIEIELTETTTDVYFRDLKRVVTGLRREGVSTAVDDFGIGYSSLNLIREIPWDVLKVDKNFLPLDDENVTSITSVMFRHVISMAQDIGMECVIEGVETEKQIQILKNNNCCIAQGYYFDKPLPVEEFEMRLDKKVYS